ncbi:MAG: hypothetical protein JNK35_03455 [Phycisphaerae bacterium]|nr:hypothetical protein [Phycisphaerae bacterium]
MSAFGTPISQPVRGTTPAERFAAKEARRRDRARPATSNPDESDTDSVEFSGPEAINAADPLAGAGDEDARQDRRKAGSEGQPPETPSLDVQG